MSRREADPSRWQGRNDGPGPEHRRWHQQIASPEQASAQGRPGHGGVALVGFASDEGVRRNGGRVGAAEGPEALRTALAPLALHVDVPLHDAGTVVVDGEDLEGGHDELAAVMAPLVDAHDLVVVLGGGHETAYGSYLGRTRAVRLQGKRIGVVNLDAHFDLRQADRPSSGTPFLQMAEADEQAGRDFDYTVVGIARPLNTPVLFETADRLGVRYVLDVDATPTHLPDVLGVIDDVLTRVDAVHLSIDLDVLPAAAAPGVSAPAAFGVPIEVLDAICDRIAASGKLVVLDVVELCPRLDIDGHTARAAARLVTTCVHALPAH